MLLGPPETFEDLRRPPGDGEEEGEEEGQLPTRCQGCLCQPVGKRFLADPLARAKGAPCQPVGKDAYIRQPIGNWLAASWWAADWLAAN